MIKEYYEALQRLVERKPNILTEPYSINNDSVALEAGRKRGSIKRSRPVFSDLIASIDKAASEFERAFSLGQSSLELEHLKSQLKFYKEEYEKALAREVSLVLEIMELQNESLRSKG